MTILSIVCALILIGAPFAKSCFYPREMILSCVIRFRAANSHDLQIAWGETDMTNHLGAFFGVILAEYRRKKPAPTSARYRARWISLLFALWTWPALASDSAPPVFHGQFYSGEGNLAYLQMLDISRRMFEPDPEYASVPMLYHPSWNGLVEGPTWGAWWVQNSYGPTYCALPFYEEPLLTFLQNSQDLWFNKMGDGQTSYVWNGKDRWIPPDGCLMDCANETWAMHKQGDGRVNIHDWGMEFTAAGALLQSELLLISRDPAARTRYLPKLERCAKFIETRRDPTNNLFLAGPAGNLLAPSYAGWKRPDGTYGMAYLAGLSVTYIAFLDRLIELEKMAGNTPRVRQYGEYRASARQGLSQLITEEGHFIKSMDPDGTKHGVYGASRYGYFEASPNHDAIAFRVADEGLARRIFAKMAAIPELRPHALILANAPTLDDMYESPQGLWSFGTWVNGGHWTTCESRMMMAYYRLGQYDDAFRSMKQIMTFAQRFRMDNPLVKFGSEVYQPAEPINVTYDAFGAPAGFIRGLFEYLYQADGLTLLPHIPPGITRLEQKFPIRFGNKRLYLATAGQGRISAVFINGQPWKSFDAGSVFLPYDQTPQKATIQILLGQAKLKPFEMPPPDYSTPPSPPEAFSWTGTPQEVISSNGLPVRIGGDSQGGSRFLGDIARIGLFNRVLNPKEIEELSNFQPSSWSKDPGLVGLWIFSHSMADTVSNLASPGLTARKVGKISMTDSPFGPAIRLRGEGFLEISSNPLLQLPRGGTLYALVRPENTNGRIIDKCPVGGATGYMLDTYPGNTLRLISDLGTLSSDAKLKPGEWVHIAATLGENGSAALYLNGQQVAFAKQPADQVEIKSLLARVARVRRFHQRLVQEGQGNSYEAAHARMIASFLVTAWQRLDQVETGKLKPLPGASQRAADRLYMSTTAKLCDGLEKMLDRYKTSQEPSRQRLYQLWLRP